MKKIECKVSELQVGDIVILGMMNEGYNKATVVFVGVDYVRIIRPYISANKIGAEDLTLHFYLETIYQVERG